MALDPDVWVAIITTAGAVVTGVLGARAKGPSAQHSVSQHRITFTMDPVYTSTPPSAPKRGVPLWPFVLAAGAVLFFLALDPETPPDAEAIPSPQPTESSRDDSTAASQIPSAPPAEPTPSPVKPIRVSASATKEGVEQRCTKVLVSYDAGNLIDGDLNTGWGTAADDGVGERFMVSFDGPVRLSEVGLTPGYLKQAPRIEANCIVTSSFPFNRRIAEVRYDFDDGSSSVQQFDESATVQTMPVEVVTTGVTVTILKTLRPAGADNDTIISEVSFMGVAQ